MKEADYILATNIAKVRVAVQVVRSITDSDECPSEEIAAATKLLLAMQDRCEAAVDGK